jgi:hypothetical protein
MNSEECALVARLARANKDIAKTGAGIAVGEIAPDNAHTLGELLVRLGAELQPWADNARRIVVDGEVVGDPPILPAPTRHTDSGGGARGDRAPAAGGPSTPCPPAAPQP